MTPRSTRPGIDKKADLSLPKRRADTPPFRRPPPPSGPPIAISYELKFALQVILLLGFLLISVGRLFQGAGRFFDDHPGPGASEVYEASTEDLCPQASRLEPVRHKELWVNLTGVYGSEGFKGQTAAWLGGAVRIPTETFDDLGEVDEDPRWQVFHPFHEYLSNQFPLTHKALELSKVNTFGLLYEWKGSDSSLKPLLLAAHQDVVPVDPTTVDEWTHPPWSGHFDGTRVWGRGSVDDKSGLIGIMSAVETLVSHDFQPTRTVVLAFGFDEESAGYHGAGNLSEAILNKYGKGSMAMIVDEGGGFSQEYGGTFALPAVGEKGYLDVRVEVSAPGGHSSVPPSHTSIGMLSTMLVQYEANPYPVHLERSSPIYGTLQCVASFAPDVPIELRQAIKASAHSDSALQTVEGIILQDVTMKSVLGTTQAIDIIQGGVKSNALPEQAWALVNHRIATTSSLEDVMEHDAALLKGLAEDFGLSYTAFGNEIYARTNESTGSLVLTDAWRTGLPPAPVTPTGSAVPYQVLSGTIRAAYHAHRQGQENVEEIYVAPAMMGGNTDTRFYWDLTDAIFRYSHMPNVGQGIHTVDEYLELDGLLQAIEFCTILILNLDESVVI